MSLQTRYYSALSAMHALDMRRSYNLYTEYMYKGDGKYTCTCTSISFPETETYSRSKSEEEQSYRPNS